MNYVMKEIVMHYTFPEFRCSEKLNNNNKNHILKRKIPMFLKLHTYNRISLILTWWGEIIPSILGEVETDQLEREVCANEYAATWRENDYVISSWR